MMKKTITLVLMLLLLVAGGQMMGQTRGAMYFGASLPMNDFGKFDGINECALFTTDATQGGANTGFNAGLKWYFSMGIKGLGVMLSIDGFYNGPCADLKTLYREGDWGGDYVDGSFSFKSTPKYVNVPAMLGLYYIYNFNPQFGIYAEAGAGGDLHVITAMETVGKKVDIEGVESSVKTTQKYDNLFSFAWQAGVGFEVANNLRIGCSFYNLGKTEVKGEETVRTTNLSSNESSTETNYRTFGALNPVMVLGRIGFSF